MDISSLVRAVVAAYEDASKLVVRIRDQRKSTDRSLPEDQTRDLLDSLSLGPVIVKGHYDHDFKRFGEPYACGDIQARENMKDVLISLQMTLIIALRSSGMDDVDLDYDALQTASDDCRVNAGVCLGQLSQRLSDAAKAQAMYPPYSNRQAMLPPMAPSLAYSSSRSTHSSNYAPRTPSDGFSERFATMSVSTARPRTGRKATGGSTSSDAQSPQPVQRSSNPRIVPSDNFGRLPAQAGDLDPDAIEALSMRRPSSHTLGPEDNDLLSVGDEDPPPRNPARSLPVQMNDHDLLLPSQSYNPHGQSQEVSRTVPATARRSPQDRFGPEDYTPTDSRHFSYETQYHHRQDLGNGLPASSYSTQAQESNHGVLERIKYSKQNSRPPRHGVNHFPIPPSRTPPPTKGLPPLPPLQGREDSVKRPSSRQASAPDPLTQFPQPRSPPSVQQTFQAPLSRLNTHPSMSAPIPLQTSQSPQRQAPPIPRVSTNHNTYSAFPQAPVQGVHQLSHSSSIRSNHSQSSSPPSATQPMTSPPHQPSPLARPDTAMSILPTNVPLTLPTDKAPLGFCKAAARLFLSPTSDPKASKSFSVANRPAGFNSMMPYWKCQKCNFEGPVCTVVNTADTGDKKKKKGKEEKIFDPKVRVSVGGGVRYRWVFLAKSHIHLKTLVDHVGGGRPARDGEVGAFGCLFCCAEGGAREWTGANGATPSVRSGSTGSSGTQGDGKGTPVFGNVQSFMDHLETHRKEEGWPGAEMMGRMKCVVGRMAGGDEEWEVNFVPI